MHGDTCPNPFHPTARDVEGTLIITTIRRDDIVMRLRDLSDCSRKGKADDDIPNRFIHDFEIVVEEWGGKEYFEEGICTVERGVCPKCCDLKQKCWIRTQSFGTENVPIRFMVFVV